MTKRLFITGATGFIGRHLVERLAGSSYNIRCLVRPSSDTTRLCEFGVDLVTGDVTDRESVRAGMEGCDRVIHLANVYSFWEPDPRIYRTVNIEGTRNVMECALDHGIAKIVHVSSVVSYGKQTGLFNEESVPGPAQSAYAASKQRGDELVWQLHRERGLPVAVVYPAAVLGPGDDKASGQYIRDLVERRLPTRVLETSVSTWVDVRDVADALVRALEREVNVGQRYFVGRHQLNFRQINELVADLSKVSLPLIGLHNPATMTTAYLLTAVSRLTKRPPPWGMAVDAIRTLRDGMVADGEKAAVELDVTYRPIRETLTDVISEL